MFYSDHHCIHMQHLITFEQKANGVILGMGNISPQDKMEGGGNFELLPSAKSFSPFLFLISYPDNAVPITNLFTSEGGDSSLFDAHTLTYFF